MGIDAIGGLRILDAIAVRFRGYQYAYPANAAPCMSIPSTISRTIHTTPMMIMTGQLFSSKDIADSIAVQRQFALLLLSRV